MKFLIEAIIIGISIVILGTFFSYIAGKFFSVELPPVCKDWNKNYVMEIGLFLTGFFAHVIFELIGLNKWYCKYGAACK